MLTSKRSMHRRSEWLLTSLWNKKMKKRTREEHTRKWKSVRGQHLWRTLLQRPLQGSQLKSLVFTDPKSRSRSLRYHMGRFRDYKEDISYRIYLIEEQTASRIIFNCEAFAHRRFQFLHNGRWISQDELLTG